MKAGRRRARHPELASLSVLLVFSPAALAQSIVLGRAGDIAWDQPRASFQFQVPGTGELVGPLEENPFPALLDTGANGVVLAKFAYFDFDHPELFNPDMYGIEMRTDGSKVQFAELGVAGTAFFDTLLPYDLVIPLDANQEVRVPNVRGLGAFDLDAGITAVVGMPAMIGRRVQMVTRAIGEDNFLVTGFLEEAHTPTPTSYRVNFEMLPADPSAGQVEEGDPLPTYADLPLIAGFKTAKGSNVSTGTVLLDTGAQLSMITTQTAIELGLNLDPDSATTDVEGSIEVGGIGGSIDAPLVVIDRLIIPTASGAELVLTNAVVGVVDIPGIGGIFGMNILTSGQVPPILSEEGEGQVGYFDTVTLDFSGAEKFMWLDVNPDYHTVGGSRSIRLAGTAAGAVAWNSTSMNWLNGAAATAYQDGDLVIFGNAEGARVVNIAEPVTPTWVTVDSSSNYTFAGQPITGFTGLTKEGTGTLTIQNENTYSGRTDIREGTVVFAAHQRIGELHVQAGAAAQFQTSQHLTKIAVADGVATLTPGGNKALVIDGSFVIISGTGKLDLTDNAMIFHVPPDPEDGSIDIDDEIIYLSALIRSGLATGNGLLGTSAPNRRLGIISNEDRPFSEFFGETLRGDEALIMNTLIGDLNFDRQVSIADFLILSTNFGELGATWAMGDVNYDEQVSIADFLEQSANFGQSLSSVAFSAQSAAVPEPGAGLVLLGLMAATRRRNRVGGASAHHCSGKQCTVC